MKPGAPDPAPAGPLVLLVDDDPALRRYLHAGLTGRGFRFIEAATGEGGLKAAVQYVPDIVLLDLGLPDTDGVIVLRRLREWSAVPVIILSARGDESRKVVALDSGADDYLTKPFGFAELLARMRVALRRTPTGGASAAELRAGPVAIDLAAHRVTVDGSEVRLTPVEFKLLAELARHAGRFVPHHQLLEAVWGPAGEGQQQYLRVYMTHLRRKLEPDAAHPRLFTTETGFGYRLNLD